MRSLDHPYGLAEYTEPKYDNSVILFLFGR
jgi:hypothetical protein